MTVAKNIRRWLIHGMTYKLTVAERLCLLSGLLSDKEEIPCTCSIVATRPRDRRRIVRLDTKAILSSDGRVYTAVKYEHIMAGLRESTKGE